MRSEIFEIKLNRFKGLNQKVTRMEVSRTYSESFRVIAQKLEKIDYEGRFSGHGIENRMRIAQYNYTTALTFDQQYSRLREKKL